jgi:DNA mismatch repair protein MLH1
MPLIIDGYTPSFAAMPLFLRNLASIIDWENEKGCFEGVLNELSSLYSILPDDERGESVKRLQNEVMTVILPEVKKDAFKPSDLLIQQSSVLRVTLPEF